MTDFADDTNLDQPVTITDVAKQAGVSIKTVSRVLNRSANVKPETKERVEQAMALMGYRPNSPARMLASNCTYLIGLIYNASSDYISGLQNGVLSGCLPEHYDLLIHPCSYGSPTLVNNVHEFVSNRRVDGLILAPPVSDVPEIHELLEKYKIPSVSISKEPVGEEDWSVCTNDREICKDMVRHLSRLGHQRIAFVRSHPDHKAMTVRYQGFLDGMHEVNLKVHDEFIVEGKNNFESGIDCGIQLLRQNPRPTAIFCANDHMAAGVMKAIHERRLQIPGDISVAGFDDIPIAGQIWPQLTTIRQPIETMANKAVEALIRLIRSENPEQRRAIVNSSLVIRQSTGPAPVDHV